MAAMNFRRRRGGTEEPEINLIPFIDVLLVILIFLMVTTTYSRFAELQISLPTADAEKAVERPRQIHVGVTPDGHYAIDRTAVRVQDPDALAAEIKRAAGNDADPVIVVDADAAATHQAVINVLEAARIAGFSRLTFATQTTTPARR